MYYIRFSLIMLLVIHSHLAHAETLRAQEQQRIKQAVSVAQANGEARIIGGSDAQLGDYPFMSALVSVGQQVTTTARVNEQTYSSTDFLFSPLGEVEGLLSSCGLAGEICTNVQGRICLIERGTFTFAEKALNCQAGGGIGAIIYNNVAGEITSGTLGNDFDGTIPVVGVSQLSGEALIQLSSPSASISVQLAGGSTQNASCGATFLGDKWVLTAAHCVDSPFADQLRVNVGEYDLSNGADDAVTIKRIYTHPNYDENTFDSDVALIELTRSVDAPAIQLADAQTTIQFANNNTVAKSIGWGGRIAYAPDEGPTGDFPDILQEVELPILSNNQCRQAFSQSQNISASATGITDNMICAAVDLGGRSACQGDSGGPLFVESNSGPLQVGITSWGIGCAASGYPGVYARVGELLGFINATRFGMGINGQANFNNSPVNKAHTQTYKVTNNSSSIISPTFSLSNTADFSLDNSNCLTLATEQSCDLLVTLLTSTAGLKQTRINLTSDVSDIPTNGIDISAFALPSASSLASAAGSINTAVEYFSGGDSVWRVNTGGGVRSGIIGGSQSSILLASIQGEGSLSFEWSVSSEENVDEPTEPFDALYLIVNGEEIDFISGEVAFARKTVELPEGDNLVEWTYRKDQNTTAGDDQALVRNISFTGVNQTDPVMLPTPIESSSGGGSSIWIMFLCMLIVPFRKSFD
ncbi:trypsin-like serine protease [Aliiglaciecola sp. LCG003]|uniref:trypsin-like serine protease n=1 Tax=Aliiglaciecola sp. LCG003 TaxID=3053655 RepID=UPI002572C719|nr:trypsin-like serine protease [Aliiglaciecola sp. LCG003]WJG08710.1 trypsin-like serine protease [Aliiglaciecola sp. LCG003]